MHPLARTPDAWELLPLQRIEKGRRLKQQGAEFMKAKDFRRACWLRLGLRYLPEGCDVAIGLAKVQIRAGPHGLRG